MIRFRSGTCSMADFSTTGASVLGDGQLLGLVIDGACRRSTAASLR